MERYWRTKGTVGGEQVRWLVHGRYINELSDRLCSGERINTSEARRLLYDERQASARKGKEPRGLTATVSGRGI